MASSYDRRGGNHDWSSYIRMEGRAAVMMESEGPGCVTRIWTADPQKGIVRVTIDGEVAIECPFKELFSRLPLTTGIGGESPESYARASAEQLSMGYTTYCPIPFQRSIKFTIEPEDDYLYYQINAHLYPPGTELESFDSNTTESKVVAEAVRALEAWADRTPAVDMGAARQQLFDLASGESSVILDHSGAGVIRGLRITVDSDLSARERDHLLENLWLVAYFDDDDSRDPSIRAPVGPFFLDYGQSPAARSVWLGRDLAVANEESLRDALSEEPPPDLPLVQGEEPRLVIDGEGETGTDFYYCYFPMPHYTKAKFVIENRSILTARLSVSVLHEASESIEPDLFRFRATWHVETPFGPDHRDYEGLACRLLNLDGHNNVELLYVPQGGGHFVGCGFVADFRDAPTDRAGGEGDEMFFVDDDPRLTMYGTGLEDYTNDAWGMHTYVGALSGDTVTPKEGSGPQLFGYRLHIPDAIPFVRTGRFTLEHGTGNNCSGIYRSVAYWYMDPAQARVRVEEWRWDDLRMGRRKMNEEV
jgi:D-arabinan exo alpha-(1,3)/(1,5)-arabinofuranosidase (non-reducing end)